MARASRPSKSDPSRSSSRSGRHASDRERLGGGRSASKTDRSREERRSSGESRDIRRSSSSDSSWVDRGRDDRSMHSGRIQEE